MKGGTVMGGRAPAQTVVEQRDFTRAEERTRKEYMSRQHLLPMAEPLPAVSVRTPAALQALAHPMRVAILDTLRDPAAAATIARRLGEARQDGNYHLKELRQAGL